MATKKYLSLDKLSLYDEKIKKVISDGDAAALQSAKDYADGLADNYDAKGAAATAEANAKAYADGKDAAIQAAHKAGTDAAAAAGVADGKAVAAQGDVDALETYVGTIPTGATATDIVGYIQEKTSGIATEGAMTELGNRVAAVEGDVATIKGDYLKAADKTELNGKITGVQTAVDTEKSRAEGIESGLRTDVDAIKGDYLKGSDKTELQGNIDTVSAAVERLTNGVSADEVDGVNDLIQYVKDHGTEVTGMQEDISDNADAIADVTGRVETLEGKFGGAEGSVEDMIADAQAAAEATAAADATSKANAAEAAAKGHADSLNTAMNARVESLEAIDHDHSNKGVLDGITSAKVTAWDNAEGNAKTYTDGLIAEFVEVTDAEIEGLFA